MHFNGKRTGKCTLGKCTEKKKTEQRGTKTLLHIATSDYVAHVTTWQHMWPRQSTHVLATNWRVHFVAMCQLHTLHIQRNQQQVHTAQRGHCIAHSCAYRCAGSALRVPHFSAHTDMCSAQMRCTIVHAARRNMCNSDAFAAHVAKECMRYVRTEHIGAYECTHSKATCTLASWYVQMHVGINSNINAIRNMFSRELN